MERECRTVVLLKERMLVEFIADYHILLRNVRDLHPHYEEDIGVDLHDRMTALLEHIVRMRGEQVRYVMLAETSHELAHAFENLLSRSSSVGGFMGDVC